MRSYRWQEFKEELPGANFGHARESLMRQVSRFLGEHNLKPGQFSLTIYQETADFGNGPRYQLIAIVCYQS